MDTTMPQRAPPCRWAWQTHQQQRMIGPVSSDNELIEDPCRAAGIPSGSRVLALVLLFVVMFGGVTIAILSDSFAAILLASALGYTACVMVYGFAKNRGNIPRYLFTCPVVAGQYGGLLKRHSIFLGILGAIVIIAFRLKPHMSDPAASSQRNDVYFFVVGIPVAILALAEILMNRGTLARAHQDRFGEPSAPDTTDRPLSLFNRD